VRGTVIAQRRGISNLAMGYSGYQNTWPEQTPYATEGLRKVLKTNGIQLQLPVYDINEKDYVLNELTKMGLKKESYEQKCTKQKYNIDLDGDILKAEIDKWIASPEGIIKSKTAIELDIWYRGNMEDAAWPALSGR